MNSAPKGYSMGQMQQFTPEQMNLFRQMFGQIGPGSFLGRLAAGDESLMQQMEAPALKQFGQLQGQIGSRFSGQGLGGRRSSAFGNTMNQASTDFASQLQQQRMGLQRQAIGDLWNMSQNLLQQRPYENYLVQKSPTFGQTIGQGLGSALGNFPMMFARWLMGAS